MIIKDVYMRDGEFIWHTWFTWYPVTIRETKVIDGIEEQSETWIWWERIERRIDKKLIDNWAGGSIYEYRLREKS